METRKRFLDKVRAIELAVLRGPRPSPGILGIQRALELKSEGKLAKCDPALKQNLKTGKKHTQIYKNQYY